MITESHLKAMEQAFINEHTRRYGFSPDREVIELINIRVSAIGTTSKIPLTAQSKSSGDPSLALKGYRQVYFPKIEEYYSTPVFNRYQLHYGNFVNGLAIIEQQDSTIIVNPHQDAHMDRFGQIIIEKAG